MKQARSGICSRAAVLTVGLALLAGCGARHAGDGSKEPAGGPTSAVSNSGDQSPELPQGWRWESFAGVDVGVPESWGDGANTSQLTTQWCISTGAKAEPVVGRPIGGTTAVGCSAAQGDGDPATLISKAGAFVAFEQRTGRVDGTTHEGDRTTVVIDGVAVLVQTTPELSDRIIATISTASPDVNGCPIHHPIEADATVRPDPATDVSTLTGVTHVAACKYSVPSPASESIGLISSTSLDGAAAAAAVAAIGQAPAGGGPDAPQDCAPDYSYGDDAIVLVIDSASGHSEVYLRYSGCDHHGFDDGTTVRTLTADSVKPFVTGPNRVTAADGVVAGIVMIG